MGFLELQFKKGRYTQIEGIKMHNTVAKLMLNKDGGGEIRETNRNQILK